MPSRPFVPGGPGLWLALLLAMSSSVFGGLTTAAPRTPFEDSGGAETPTYAETVAWLEDLAESSPLIRLTTFGVSPQGRGLPLVITDRDGLDDPAACRRGGNHAILLIQACIHAGETCGKDAGMLLLRDLAADPELAAPCWTRSRSSSSPSSTWTATSGSARTGASTRTGPARWAGARRPRT